MASRAHELPLRSEQRRSVQQHGAETGSRAKKGDSSAADAGGAAGAGTQQQQQQPQIIECRKKNSTGESVVTHRYYKGRLLGKGGFAHCYKVTCVDSMRVYAMKIVPKSTLLKSRARQKLQTEIKIHRTLEHPRIVHFEKFFEDKENVYILLELCANHSLSELIRKTKRFTEAEARRYMLQILEATSYLHRHQIIHRDLKLGNVFLDRDWNIKMGDFGLATKLVQDSERKRTICGTPNYIAPEILEGTAGHSYQVDLWSAGVILYTMLVGRPPYESTDVKSTYRRILANVYAFPETVPVSDSAKNLVGRLLQVKPELRPSLDEILNHPFLRNGGPPQRFSTAHGLRGSYSSSSTATGKSQGRAVAAPSGCTATQKQTPERCEVGDGGGLSGRPPLKTRNANMETGSDQVDGGAHVGAITGKSRLASNGTAAEGGNRVAQGRHGSSSSSELSADAKRMSSSSRVGATSTIPSTAAAPLATRSGAAASRNTTSNKGGFIIYCDAKDGPGAAGGSRASPSSTVYTAAGRRTSPRVGGSGRREAAAVASPDAEGTAAISDDKENDPRSAALIGAGGRVAVKVPITRRPLMRAASAVEPSDAREALAASSGNSRGSALVRKPLLRSASGIAGTTYAEGRIAARRSATNGVGTARTSAGAGSEGGGRVPSDASPHTRVSTRGSRSPATERPATRAAKTTSSYSPYRSPAALGVGSCRGVAAGASSRGTGGDGVTPSQPTRRATRASAQQKLEFGSTPRPTRTQQRQQQQQQQLGAAGIGRSSARLTRRGEAAGGAEPRPPTVAPASISAGASSGAADPTGADCGIWATPPPSQRRQMETGRDTLETMHDLLSNSFAVDRDAALLPGAAVRVGRGLPSAAERVTVAASVGTEASSPSVWVTRYVDYSSKYGLGFLLSDGSAGVYFNDATKIVLEPAGVSFDYVERARRSSPPTAVTGSANDGASSDGGSTGGTEQPPRIRHTLDDFPRELQKKVTLLNHFRGYLHELVKKDDSGSAAAAAAAAQGLAGGLKTGQGKSGQGHAGRERVPLIFLKKWLRTRNAILFRLSNRTVQVVFSDHTEILLSKEARLVTFVDKDGNRETQSLQRVVQEQRGDITKRLRYSKELIAQLLRRA